MVIGSSSSAAMVTEAVTRSMSATTCTGARELRSDRTTSSVRAMSDEKAYKLAKGELRSGIPRATRWLGGDGVAAEPVSAGGKIVCGVILADLWA